MNVEVLDLVGQQEAIRHEAVVVREEPLQSRDNNAEDVLLRKVLYNNTSALLI